jgi:hypothetical protein
MKYWIFVNNEINGPFKINEIVNSKYFSKDLLLCPYEMDGIKPSNWYFAKELPEFEPYLSSVSVAVENKGFDVDFDIDSLIEGAKIDSYKYDEIERNLNLDILDNKTDLEEKLFKSEKELEHYKTKVNYLEEKISKLQIELEKTLNRVKEYEYKIKERDFQIEKLIEEVNSLKEKENIVKDYEKEIYEKNKKIDELTEKLKEFEEKVKQTEQKRSDKNDSIQEVKIEEIKSENESSIRFDEKKEENNIEKNDNFSSISQSNLSSSIDVNKDLSFNKEITEDKESSKIDLESSKNKESYSDVSFNNDFVIERFDVFSHSSKKLTPISVDDNNLSIETFLNNSDNVDIKTEHLTSKPFEKVDLNSVFQTADIKLEVVKPNLDLVENKMEVVSKPPIKDEYTKNFEETKNISIENNIKTEEKFTQTESKEIGDNKVLSKEKSFESELKIDFAINNDINRKEIKKENTDLNVSLESLFKNDNNKEDNNVKQENKVLLSVDDRVEKIKIEKENLEASLKREEINKTQRFDFTKDKKDEDKKIKEGNAGSKNTIVSSIYRKKVSPFVKIVVFGVFIVFFAGSIIYILNSGSDKNTIKVSKENVRYPKFEKSDEKIAENNIDNKAVLVSTKTEDKSEINISKINENVKKSIDIVKNFDLGGGRGNIEKWFSNSFSNKSVKEEWNATYLSGSLFVVQYRALRYKQEPIVYLFEVDVDKGVIVRGINNNAIDLLSSVYGNNKKEDNKKVAKLNIKDKKTIEEVKNNSEIF